MNDDKAGRRHAPGGGFRGYRDRHGVFHPCYSIDAMHGLHQAERNIWGRIDQRRALAGLAFQLAWWGLRLERKQQMRMAA